MRWRREAHKYKFERFYRSDGLLSYFEVVDQDTGDALRIHRLGMPRKKSSVALSIVLFVLVLAEGTALVAFLALQKDEASYILPVGFVLFVACGVLWAISLEPPWRFRAVRPGDEAVFDLMSNGSRWVRRRRLSVHRADGEAIAWLMRTSIWPPGRNWVCYSIHGEEICHTVMTREGLGWFRGGLALVCPGRFGLYRYVSHGRMVGTYDCWQCMLKLAGDAGTLPTPCAMAIGVFLNSPYWA